MFSKGGEPYLKFYNKKGLVLDEMLLSWYDTVEINKILASFGRTYVPELTWEQRESASKFLNAAGIHPGNE